MTGQWPTTPVFGDETEHSMFDLVPLAGSRRKVTNMERKTEIVGQILQRNFPQSITAAVAAATVGCDG